MTSITIRQLNEATKVRLKARALRHGRSLEAEARAILTQAANEDEPPAAAEPFPYWFIRMTRPGVDLDDILNENRQPHAGIDL